MPTNLTVRRADLSDCQGQRHGKNKGRTLLTLTVSASCLLFFPPGLFEKPLDRKRKKQQLTWS
ncbi:hypothetical protein XI25_05190 [Paenibacillus sp. DMB20]|nr:hypothetical protein XI25_05190 [Paenibacillus sp. DMB20]